MNTMEHMDTVPSSPPAASDAPLGARLPAPPREAPFLRLFARVKWRMGNNHLANLRKHMWIHVGVGLFVLILLIGGGTMMFDVVFGFLMNQEPFGPPLMDRLIKMVLLAFFSMLIFSNLIIMMTTTYISREVEFLMSQPVGHRRLFFGKLGESLLYSSWAFVILSFPFFVALGRSRHMEWWWFGGAALAVIPYLIIPATIGALLAMLITAFFPPRQMIRFAVVLALLGILSAVLTQRQAGWREMFRDADRENLTQMMQFMGLGDLLFLPSGWVGRALLALERADLRESLFWMGMLWSTAAMGLVVCDWLAGALYYRGWCNARLSGSVRRLRRSGLYQWFDRLLRLVPAPTRSMIVKDASVFWRDPGQWGQLMILFGLLFIYIGNLRSAAGMGRFQIFIPFWQSLISLFNIGATTFVLSILTTRFVYPMLSLEGRQQWIIGLAPVPSTRIVWVKFLLSCLGTLMMSIPLALLSCLMLRADTFIVLLALVTVSVLSLGLSSLAVGLGALLPNFNEDNPSRIANGLGGTLNAIVSLIYIGLSLTLMGPWVQAYVQKSVPTDGLARLLFQGSIPAWAVLQVAMITLPLAIGLRRWRKMEF